MFSFNFESRSKADEELVMRYVQHLVWERQREQKLSLPSVDAGRGGQTTGMHGPKAFWMLHCIVHIFVVMLDIRSFAGFANLPDLSEVGERAMRASLKVVFPNEVGFVARLQYLVLRSYLGGKLPASSRLVLLCKAIFCNCKDVKALTGLSSKLSNLQVPNLGNCRELRSCPRELESLPNTGRLRNLRILKVSGCPLVHEVPGLGETGALERLHAGMEHKKPSSWLRLPDMRKLNKLRALRSGERRLETEPGFDNSRFLRAVEADLRVVARRPSLRQLTKSKALKIHGWNVEGLEELARLHTYEIRDCGGVDEVPGLRSLMKLRRSWMQSCVSRM